MKFITCRMFALLMVTAPLSLVGCSNFASQGVNVDGVRMHQRGDYQSASNRFREAIANNPTGPDGYYNLAATLHHMGRMYKRENDLRQAENLYNQCLERDPNHVECYRGLAVLLTETGRNDAAFRLLDGWKEASPNSPEPRVELARMLQETGSTDAAKGQLVEALSLDPYNSRALAALGRMRDEGGDFAQAALDYQRSLAINHHQPQVRDRLATLQASLGMIQSTSINSPTSGTRVVRQPSTTVRY